MRSASRGKRTSATEVSTISAHGIWLWLGDREVFLSYAHFPWFKEAAVGQVLNVKRVSQTHVRWPDLDVDLHVDSIDHPQKYPLVSKAAPTKRRDPARQKSNARRARG